MTKLLARMILPLALLAACGPADSTEQLTENENQTETPVADTQKPHIVTFTPAQNAKGVRRDAPFTVTFSEPMNPDSVIAAYVSDSMPAGDMDFTFNSTNDTMTITPKANSGAIVYAYGYSWSTAAIQYSFIIGPTATDVAGNQLQDGVQVSFQTARHLELDFSRVSQLSGTVTSTGQAIAGYGVGDVDSTTSIRTLLSFSLEDFQSRELVEVQHADLTFNLGYVGGNPFSLGSLLAEHVSYTTGASGYSTGAFGLPYLVATGYELSQITLDVTGALAADIDAGAARNYANQYRFRFETATNGDNVLDAAQVANSMAILHATLLVK